MIARIVCTSKGGPLLRPSHRAAVVDIHNGRDEERFHPHCSSLHPSTLSITAIAQEKVAFGTAAKGRRTYGNRVLHQSYICLKCGLAKICSALTPLLSRHQRLIPWYCNVLSFENIPCDLLSPSTFSSVMELGRAGRSSITLSESVTQNHASMSRLRNGKAANGTRKCAQISVRTSHKHVFHQRSPAASLTDTLPHCDTDVTDSQKA